MSEYRGEDVLVLAGDIASGSTNTMDVIKHFLKQGFPHIVYVPGNHEYYGTGFDEFNAKMENKCMEFDNVHFLNPGSVTIDGVLFTGGTLWTNFADNPFSQSAKTIELFNSIKHVVDEGIEIIYDQEFVYDYIQQVLNEIDERCITK
jgi:hypothetical protein